MRTNSQSYISKSKYLSGLQCHKLLWHAYNAKHLIPEPDAQTQAISIRATRSSSFLAELRSVKGSTISTSFLRSTEVTEFLWSGDKKGDNVSTMNPALQKPIVFLSHASKDKEQLGKLKALVDQKTSGVVEFFLSSDGQSIPFGRNWVARVSEALDKAKLMFVFLSPLSVNSGWIV